MIYDSVDNIPAKLYFTIQSTGKFDLLVASGQHTVDEIEDAWNKIEKENADQPGNSGLEKILTVSRKFEMFSAEYEGASLALHLLKSFRDIEVVHQMKENGFKFNWIQGDYSENNENAWKDDLTRIKKEINGLKIRLDAARDKLPKDQEKESDATFESTCLGYSTFIDAGFVDTNTIVLSQFNAIIKIGNDKIKILKNG